MRATAFVFALLLSIPAAAAAQEWEEYTSLQDGFTLNFPGQPQVTESRFELIVLLSPSRNSTTVLAKSRSM